MNPTFNISYKVRGESGGSQDQPHVYEKDAWELSESCYPHVCAYFNKRHGLKSEMGQLRQSPGEFQCRASCCPIPVKLRAAPIPPNKDVGQHTQSSAKQDIHLYRGGLSSGQPNHVTYDKSSGPPQHHCLSG